MYKHSITDHLWNVPMTVLEVISREFPTFVHDYYSGKKEIIAILCQSKINEIAITRAATFECIIFMGHDRLHIYN